MHFYILINQNSLNSLLLHINNNCAGKTQIFTEPQFIFFKIIKCRENSGLEYLFTSSPSWMHCRPSCPLPALTTNTTLCD